LKQTPGAQNGQANLTSEDTTQPGYGKAATPFIQNAFYGLSGIREKGNRGGYFQDCLAGKNDCFVLEQ